MRSLHKYWDNREKLRIGRRRTYNGWNRRVQWYEDSESIRLKFQDTDGVCNKHYKNPEERELAEADYAKFKRGEVVQTDTRPTLEDKPVEPGSLPT